MGLWPWIHGWFWLAFHPGASASACDISPRATCCCIVVVGVSMYGCESFATSFQFFLLAFQLVVSPYQWYDTTTTTTTTTPSLRAPHGPPSFTLKNLVFHPLFPKTICRFHYKWTTTMFSSLWPQGKYVQLHSLTTIDVWKAPLWTPRKMMKTYLHELNKYIKKSFFSFLFSFCSFIYGVVWKAR